MISFHMTEKSPPTWTTVGQTISLSCKTSKPWNMCRWVMPNGVTCDSLSSDAYEVSCARNSRVKFKVNYVCTYVSIPKYAVRKLLGLT